MISLQNINFKYDNSNELVLNNLSLEVERGKILAIIGASGCGKSTILRIIAGLEKPQSGNVIINGNDVSNVPTENRNVGFMFQEYALFPHMTVYQNILFGLKKDNGRVKEIAAIVGIAELLERYPHELSGGQRQRVALARSVAYQPSVLLLDEPFSNLDTELKDHIRLDLLKILKRLEITAILVTHDKEDAEVLADEVVNL